jgi:hypothetical protein
MNARTRPRSSTTSGVIPSTTIASLQLRRGAV